MLARSRSQHHQAPVLKSSIRYLVVMEQQPVGEEWQAGRGVCIVVTEKGIRAASEVVRCNVVCIKCIGRGITIYHLLQSDTIIDTASIITQPPPPSTNQTIVQ